MKRFYTILISLLAFAAISNGQTIIGAGYTRQTLNSDLDVTFNGSYVEFTKAFSATRNFGAEIGIGASYYYANDFLPDYDFYGNISFAWQEVYIDVPVQLNYSLPLSTRVILVPFIGATGSIGVQSKYVEKYGSTKTGSSVYDNADYRRLDLAATAGLNIDICSAFRVKASYNWGLIDRETDRTAVYRDYLKVGVAYLF